MSQNCKKNVPSIIGNFSTEKYVFFFLKASASNTNMHVFSLLILQLVTECFSPLGKYVQLTSKILIFFLVILPFFDR